MSALAHDVVITAGMSARQDVGSPPATKDSARAAFAPPPQRGPAPAAFARCGLLVVCVLCAVAYVELLRWNDASSGLVPGSPGDSGDIVRGVFSARDSVKDKATPSARRPAAKLNKSPPPTAAPTAAPTRNALVVAERGPLRALGADNGPSSRVCVTEGVCMRASEWDALQATLDCWGRPGSWRRDASNGALHGRRWHRKDGRPLAGLPASMQYAWTPSGGEDSTCTPPIRAAFLPFYKGDFCVTLAKRRILLVGDLMNNQFREAIAEGAAPGGKPVFRPRPSRGARPSVRPQAPPPSRGASAAPSPPMPSAAEASDYDDDTGAAAAAAAAGDDYGNATDAETELVEEVDEEAAGSLVCDAAHAGGANCTAGGQGDDDYGDEEAQRKRAQEAAEALLNSDKDSIGRDGMTEAGALDEDGSSAKDEDDDQTAGAGGANSRRGLAAVAPGAPTSSLQRLMRFITAAKQRAATVAARQRLQRAGAPPPPFRPRSPLDNVAAPVNGTAAAGQLQPRARRLANIFRGATSAICDVELATTVEFRRNDRLYVDGDRVPRLRSHGYWEFPWTALVPRSDVVVLARPVKTQSDSVYFATLRRTLRHVRAANPRAVVIVRNVVPPHVDCSKATGPLYKRQPPGWLSHEAAASYGQNEALRLFLRTEFPGVIHLDVATSTALRPDGHADARCTTYTPPGESPGPLDNWVRLLFNALHLVDLARLGKRFGGAAASGGSSRSRGGAH